MSPAPGAGKVPAPLLRGDVWVAGGGALAVVAAPVTLVAGTRAGLVVLALGLGVALLGCALVLRRLTNRLVRVDATARETRRQLRRTAAGSDATTSTKATAERGARAQQAVGRRVEELTRRLAELDDRERADAFRFRTSLDTLPSDLLRLQRYADLLAPGSTRLPGLGHWAVTPGTLVTVLDEVYARPADVTVLECGSGSSTLFVALALAERGLGGHVVALESDAVYAEATREQLRQHGVDSYATVVDAPLVEQELAGCGQRLWYDLSGLPALTGVDVLFVDGPIGGTSRLARFPALPVLGDRLNAGALVVLDDTDRVDEKEILRLWGSRAAGEPALVVESSNVRSTFLRLGDPA